MWGRVVGVDMRTVPLVLAVVSGLALVGGCQQQNLPESYWRAAWENDPEMAQRLYDEGIQVEPGDDDLYPALVYALHQGHYEVAEIIVDAGADVNETVEGQPMIEYLRSEGKESAVEWLKDHGAVIKP